MKPSSALIILLTIVMVTSCSKYRFNFLHQKNKLIALQPLGDFDSTQTAFIQTQVSSFYDREVIVLKPIPLPPDYILPQTDRLYMADSILHLLSSLINDSITEVVGLTNAAICTLKDPSAREEAKVENVKIIFGLAHVSGNVCLVSGHGLLDADPLVLKHRIKTVTLHEMGHNLGLAHCPATTCLMSDTNGRIESLDRNENQYCEKCKRRLK